MELVVWKMTDYYFVRDIRLPTFDYQGIGMMNTIIGRKILLA